MSKIDSPINVLITVSIRSSLIKQLQEVSPLLRITVHPAETIDDVPDELWARCEVLYTKGIIPDAELAPNLNGYSTIMLVSTHLWNSSHQTGPT